MASGSITVGEILKIHSRDGLFDPNDTVKSIAKDYLRLHNTHTLKDKRKFKIDGLECELLGCIEGCSLSKLMRCGYAFNECQARLGKLISQPVGMEVIE